MAHKAQNGKDGNIKSSFPPRKRVWAFTLNNWTTEEVAHWHNTYLEYGVTKFKFQAEIGEECGTPHLQGVCSFENPVREWTVKQLFPRGYWKLARNPRDLYLYCHKDETWDGINRWEWELPKKVKPPKYTNVELNTMLYSEYIKMEELCLDPPLDLTESHTYRFKNKDGVEEKGIAEIGRCQKNKS